MVNSAEQQLHDGLLLIENNEAAKQSSELCQRNEGLIQAINELEEFKGDPGPGSSEQASQVQQADAHNAAVAAVQQSLGVAVEGIHAA